MSENFICNASAVIQDGSPETVITNEKELNNANQNSVTRFMLVLIGGPQGHVEEEWTIQNPEELVGRNPDCDIQFNDRSVSRLHCKFTVKEGNLFVTDLGSTNSTKVNGTVISPQMPIALKDDDRIKMGNIVLRLIVNTVTECDWI